MSGAGEFADGLLLAAYVPMRDIGFALPCYATHPRANAWNVATCSIEGDHAGIVSGFEHFEHDRVVVLPADLHMWVRIGDPWRDVFLWDGLPRVGTAAQILSSLNAEAQAVAAAVPLTWLDLSLGAGKADLRSPADEAFRHVEDRRGAATAVAWRRDVLLAGEARLAVRRELASHGVGRDILDVTRAIAVVDRDGGFEVVLPKAIAAALTPEKIDDARRHLEDLGRRLGVELRLARAASVAEQARAPARVEPWGNKAWWPGAPVAILVIALGDRARAVARHLSRPDWIPLPHAPDSLTRWEVRREPNDWNLLTDKSVVDVFDRSALPESVERYAVVVWLLEDAEIHNSRFDAFARELVGGSGSSGRTVHLLAPALPLLTPSTVLSSLGSGGRGGFPGALRRRHVARAFTLLDRQPGARDRPQDRRRRDGLSAGVRHRRADKAGAPRRRRKQWQPPAAIVRAGCRRLGRPRPRVGPRVRDIGDRPRSVRALPSRPRFWRDAPGPHRRRRPSRLRIAEEG